jgi:hypothetical protein
MLALRVPSNPIFAHMRNLLVLSLGMVILSSCASLMTKRKIQFNYHVTEDYCGGAFPSEDILEELKTPKLYNGTLYMNNNPVREGKEIKLEFTNGVAKQKGFKAGTYFVFKDKKMDADSVHQAAAEPTDDMYTEEMIDPICLLMHNSQPLGTVQIDKKTRIVADSIHIMCNPCLPPQP